MQEVARGAGVAGPIGVSAAGIQCVELPLAGLRRGLAGTQSVFVLELIRAAWELEVPMRFLRMWATSDS